MAKVGTDKSIVQTAPDKFRTIYDRDDGWRVVGTVTVVKSNQLNCGCKVCMY